MSQLEILHTWAGMFMRMIERFETRQYAHFDVIIRSDDLSSVYVALLALCANQNNAVHQSSVISFSGI